MFDGESISVKSLREQVYELLRNRMEKGNICPGDYLNLNELSESLGISRTPLREALIQLQVEGFVTIYPRRGIRVNPLTQDDIRYAYQIVGALEASVILRNFDILYREKTDQMYMENRLMREALERGDFNTFYSHNLRFHNTYLLLTPNQRLIDTVLKLKNRLYDFPRREGFVKEWETVSTGEHEKFTDLVVEGKREEAAAYARDIHWSFNNQAHYIKEYYKELEKNR